MEHPVIRIIPHEFFAKGIQLITKKKLLAKGSPLTQLNSIIDENGLFCVGGLLSQANLFDTEHHPLILPGSHKVPFLLAKHYHQQTKHQGRHFTHCRICAAGYWIIREKRLVNRIIHDFIPCRKLRGNLVHQKMADLPSKRLALATPFTY